MVRVPSMTALLRLILVFVAVVARDCAVTPPNANPPTEQLREQHGPEFAVPLGVLMMKTWWWSWALLEGAILFALSGYCPPDLAQPLLHTLPLTTPTSDLTKLTPAFLIGTFLTLAGSILRLHCFRVLGPHFTLQLSIRPTHTLVTDGVYAIVRHPSYTACVALWIGHLFCLLDPQGSVMSMLAGLLHAPLFGGKTSGDLVLTGLLACTWVMAVYPLYPVLDGRMKREDAMLEKNFGDEWRRWAIKVPYLMVPGVY